MSDKNDHCDNPTCQEAADRAVKKVFAILGVDVDKPESVEEFREGLRFGKKMCKAADHGLLTMMGVIAAWVTADRQVVPMTLAGLQSLWAAMVERGAVIYARRLEMEAAVDRMSLADLAGFSPGWPAATE